MENVRIENERQKPESYPALVQVFGLGPQHYSLQTVNTITQSIAHQSKSPAMPHNWLRCYTNNPLEKGQSLLLPDFDEYNEDSG